MQPGGPSGADPATNGSALIDRQLDPGETVWADVPGTGGDLLMVTERRLFHVQRTGAGVTSRDWPLDVLGEIRPMGGRPGQLPGRFLIEDARRGGPLISFAIDPGRREDAMQAVTVVQLLIARAHARRREAIGRPATRVHDAGDPVDRARHIRAALQTPSGHAMAGSQEAAVRGEEARARTDQASPEGREGSFPTMRSAAPTTRSPR